MSDDDNAKMNIDNVTIGEARRLIAQAGELCRVFGMGSPVEPQPNDGLWEVGKAYFIRTVTHHFVGRLIAVTNHELWIEDVAWVADDGRFHECLATGKVNECEPCPPGPVPIGRSSLIDAHLWPHALLREVK